MFDHGFKNKSYFMDTFKVSREGRAVSSVSSHPLCCQADDCDFDLSCAKRYHRRHKVCVRHAKAAVVLVGGVDQRFHEISQFDNAKRSCRKRLAGHNECRRKTIPDIQAEDI
ncbi:hypothetical protein HHK36_008789 [Tetracentron sinense]|uniref:SBP-type domain-containing protein n=1 Tax=Tetracentron sinense TaxID=13715 RepID=A0A835DJM8_TETSI|nr:hypothetical protein HHK36_008789 [Tetracentron sinense]